jgi:hypothetical protein
MAASLGAAGERRGAAPFDEDARFDAIPVEPRKQTRTADGQPGIRPVATPVIDKPGGDAGRSCGVVEREAGDCRRA